MPASAAGLSGSTLPTSAPFGLVEPERLGGVLVDRLDLRRRAAAVDRAVLPQLVDDLPGRSRGMAKPMPTLPPEGEKIAVLTPITSPFRLKVGPPELPRLIGASIWMKSS